MTLLHFHSHHPLSYKESIIYSQALRYNMIISEDHILQKEFNNLTRILLARAYPLHLVIKNIKKALTHSRNYLSSQRAPTYTDTDIPTIIYSWRYNHSGHTCFLFNTGHTQLILMPWTMNGTSRHPMKILISSNPHAVNLGSSATHC